MGGAAPRKCAGNDESCPYGKTTTARIGAVPPLLTGIPPTNPQRFGVGGWGARTCWRVRPGEKFRTTSNLMEAMVSGEPALAGVMREPRMWSSPVPRLMSADSFAMRALSDSETILG